MLFCVGYNILVFNNYLLMNINLEVNLSVGIWKYVRYIVVIIDEIINKWIL